LNEYEDLSDAEECEKWKIDEYDRISEWGWRSQWTNGWICSKKFWFIKWLVENDKIDRDKVDDKFERPFYWYTNYEIVLMLLSISSSPIDDLISYLK
jgi:hypothetical protein